MHAIFQCHDSSTDEVIWGKRWNLGQYLWGVIQRTEGRFTDRFEIHQESPAAQFEVSSTSAKRWNMPLNGERFIHTGCFKIRLFGNARLLRANLVPWFLANFVVTFRQNLSWEARKTLKVKTPGIAFSHTNMPIYHVSITSYAAAFAPDEYFPTFLLVLGSLHAVWGWKLCVIRCQLKFQQWMHFRCGWGKQKRHEPIEVPNINIRTRGCGQYDSSRSWMCWEMSLHLKLLSTYINPMLVWKCCTVFLSPYIFIWTSMIRWTHFTPQICRPYPGHASINVPPRSSGMTPVSQPSGGEFETAEEHGIVWPT